MRLLLRNRGVRLEADPRAGLAVLDTAVREGELEKNTVRLQGESVGPGRRLNAVAVREDGGRR
jgi:hypothetical protein